MPISRLGDWPLYSRTRSFTQSRTPSGCAVQTWLGMTCATVRNRASLARIASCAAIRSVTSMPSTKIPVTWPAASRIGW
jgi:hypothetical protein